MNTQNRLKSFCSVHHYWYSGAECPFCQQERMQNLAKKYEKKTEETVVVEKPRKTEEKQREITENDLQKLVEKFNGKK